MEDLNLNMLNAIITDSLNDLTIFIYNFDVNIDKV